MSDFEREDRSKPLKVWVHIGDVELLYDEIVEWVRDMKDAANDVTTRIEHGAPHDMAESRHINGFRKEGEPAIKAAAQ